MGANVAGVGTFAEDLVALAVDSSVLNQFPRNALLSNRHKSPCDSYSSKICRKYS